MKPCWRIQKGHAGRFPANTRVSRCCPCNYLNQGSLQSSILWSPALTCWSQRGFIVLYSPALIVCIKQKLQAICSQCNKPPPPGRRIRQHWERPKADLGILLTSRLKCSLQWKLGECMQLLKSSSPTSCCNKYFPKSIWLKIYLLCKELPTQ